MKYTRLYTLTLIGLLLSVTHLNAQAIVTDSVRIMAYNLLNFPGSTAPKRLPLFAKIVEAAKPDILVVEELNGQVANTQFLNSALNVNRAVYSTSTNFIDSWDTDNGLFYKSDKFTFIANNAINLGPNSRYSNEYILRHNNTQDTIRIYVVHLKASNGSDNELARGYEIARIRQHTDSLPTGSNFLIMGDFNFYTSTEPGYINLTDKTTKGYFVDPIYMPGDWHDVSKYAAYYTQSPRVRQFEGGSNGGMDDRFDLILYSQAVADSGGMMAVAGHMTAFGNDGKHYNDSINSRPNTSVSDDVADAIHYASDHIPIYCDFTFSKMGVAVWAPNSTIAAVSVYPNPTKDVVSLSYRLNRAEHITISIIDVSGREVYVQYAGKLNIGNHTPQLNVESLTDGVYLVKIQSGSSVQISRLIIRQ